MIKIKYKGIKKSTSEYNQSDKVVVVYFDKSKMQLWTDVKSNIKDNNIVVLKTKRSVTDKTTMNELKSICRRTLNIE